MAGNLYCSQNIDWYIPENLILVLELVLLVSFTHVKLGPRGSRPNQGTQRPNSIHDCSYIRVQVRKHLMLMKEQYCATFWAGIQRKKNHKKSTESVPCTQGFFHLLFLPTICHQLHISSHITTHLWHHHLCHY